VVGAGTAGGIPVAAVGSVGGDRLVVTGVIDLPLAALTAAFGEAPE
jgi:hypothetical protein